MHILCNNFFSQYVNSNDIVLDLAAGYCDFINNIQCGEKYAVDLNEDVKKFANNNVNIFLESSTNMKSIKENAIDVVFVSNFWHNLTHSFKRIVRLLFEELTIDVRSYL